MYSTLLLCIILCSLIQSSIQQQINCTKLECPEKGFYFDAAKTCSCQECCPSCTSCVNSQSCEVCSPNTTIYSGLMNTVNLIVCYKGSGNILYGVATTTNTQNLGAGWSDEKCRTSFATLNPGTRCLSKVEMCFIDKTCFFPLGQIIILFIFIMV